jgi:hypothetical protein
MTKNGAFRLFMSSSKLETTMNKLTEQDGKSLDMVNENLEALKAECFINKQESRADFPEG